MSQQKQRFALRKLTVGVASVLLGTTFFLGGVAHADANSEVAESTDVTTTNSGDATQGQQVTLTNGQTNSQTQSTSDSANQTGIATDTTATTTAATTDQTAMISAQAEVNADQSSQYDTTVPVFSGTVNWQAQSTYQAGDTDTIQYVIQSGNGSNSVRTVTYDRSSQYLLIIPAGFDATTSDLSIVSGNNADYQFAISDVQDLGNVGPDEERVFLITLAQTPSWTSPLVIQAKITATSNGAGAHTYTQWSNQQLLLGVSGNLLPDFPGYGGSTYTYNFGGQEYTTVTSSIAFNGQQSGTISYTVVPGKQALDTSDFQVTNISAKATDGATTADLGYEELDPTIKITGTVNDGDYIDFHLGLPYTDSDGNQDEELYDNTLVKDHGDIIYQGKTIGTVYNMGTYYRLVFNDNVNQFGQVEVTLQLRWGADTQQASVNAGKVYVYQATDDANKDTTSFDFTPQNDVTINGKSYKSGLTVKGQYIYTAEPIATGNVHFGTGASYSVNRTWDQNNQVQINTLWHNNYGVAFSTQDHGDEFELHLTYHVDPTGHINYSVLSADEMKQQILDHIATPDQQNMSDQVTDADGIYTKLDKIKGEKPDVDVTVTKTEETSDTDPNTKNVTWHVKLTNKDTNSQVPIRLTGSVIVATASANNFTLPSDVTSYDEDLAAANKVINGNYGSTPEKSAATGNTALMEALQNTTPMTAYVTAIKDGKVVDTSGTYGSPWYASIQYTGGNLTGGGNVSDLVAATITIKDADNGETLTPDGLTYQGSTGTAITFDGLQAAYDALVAQGYTFVKAVSVQNGTETSLTDPDLTKLDSDTFGAASKTNNSFVIYMAKPKQQTQIATIEYIDEDNNGQELSHEQAEGKVGDAISFTTDPATQIADYISQHYVLAKVTTPDGTLSGDQLKNLDWSTLLGQYGSTSADFKVYFTHQTQPVNDEKTITEAVHFINDDGTPARDDYTATVKFTRTGTEDLTDGTKSWGNWTPTTAEFGEVDVAAPENYHVVSAKLADGTDVLDSTSQQVKAQSVTANSADLVITVHYAHDEQPVEPVKTSSATIKYIDDDNNGEVLKNETVQGKVGDAISFATAPADQITDYLNQHYQLKSSNFTAGDLFTDDDQIFEVHLTHAKTTVSQQASAVETIDYKYLDGQTAAPTNQQTITYTRTGIKDLVNNQTTWGAWQAEGAFKAVTSPTIDNYQASIAVVEVPAVETSQLSVDQPLNFTYHVTYRQVEQPTPEQPETPTTPDQPATPTEPDQSVVPTQPVTTDQPAVATPTTATPVQEKAKAAQLPQTGNRDNTGLVALGFASLIGMLGLTKRKKQD